MTVWARKSVIYALVLISFYSLLIIGLIQSAKAPAFKTSYITAKIGERNFELEIADTPESHQQGLSGRTEMPNEKGMLFAFSTPESACFWMKDMEFNLSVLWFDADRKLIYQQQNVAPSSYPKSFCPSALATYVVEVNPNLVDMKLGDELVLQKQ